MSDTKECLVIDEEGYGHFVTRTLWSVYFLFRGYNIIYVGCSCDVENRISAHKLDKKFDSYTIYFSSINKQEALDMERRIISFCINYTEHPLLNVSGIVLKSEKISI